jgi:methionyl-tRNA formyltransferase
LPENPDIMALQAIILLTGPVEQPVLSKVLLGHNPGLTIRPVETSAELAAVAPELLSQARLIAFTSPIVVPLKVLNLLGFGAYNFHPASPDFPGWAPAHFAVYHQATHFGATAHVMTERVDAGPIVDVELFSIPRDISVGELQQRAYSSLARLFWRQAKNLATQPGPLAQLPIRWSGKKTTRSCYAAMCSIPSDISGDERARRVRAFGGRAEMAHA